MSILSKARELLDKYKGTASSALNYFNPTSNQGNNFWSSSGGQGLANIQRSVQQAPQVASNFVRSSIQNTPVNRFDRAVPQIKSNIKGNLQALSNPNTSVEWSRGFGDTPLGNVATGFFNNWVAPAAQIPYQYKQLTNKQNTGFERGAAGLQLGGNLLSTMFPGAEDLLFAGYQGVKQYNKSRLEGGNLKQSLLAAKKGVIGEEYAGLGDALIKDNGIARDVLNMGELPIMLLAGAGIRKGSGVGFDKNVVNNFKNTIFADEEAKNIVKQFSTLVETTPNPNKKEFGEIGKMAQILMDNLFGKKKASGLTNTQIKNAFDILYSQAETGTTSIKRMPFGLSTSDVRKDLNIKPTVEQQPLSVAETPMTPVKDVVTKRAGLLDRKLPQLGEIATKELQNQELSIKKPQVEGAGAGRPSSTNIITDPVQKVISLLEEAKPMNEKQLELYKAERSRRAGAIAVIGKNIKGEKGFYTQLGALKGELPKVQFERIRNGLKQADIDSLFNKVEDANITPFEKISAKSGLAKLLGAEGGQVPVKSELSLLSEIFPPELIQAIQAKRPFTQRLWSGIEGALNLPRSIMATADLSAPLRQGFFFISRPKQWGPAFKNMFKYAGSEKAYAGLMDDIKSRPNYLKMRESKLALTDMSPNLLAREEEFMSNLAEKIPGFGALAKASNRAYSGFLNKLRADVFDDLVSKAEMQGIKIQGKTLEDLGSFINSATGRGNLGKTMQKAAPILNGVFFSPRLMASRINLLNPATYVKYDPFVRKEAVKSLIGTGTIAMSILGLSKLAGAEVGTDPRSADFGKIKIGNTRYDILGGFQQYIKLMAQLASGQVVSSTTGKVITLGEGYKPLTRKDILMRFFEAKTSPVASFVISLITGQTGVGEPVNIPTEIINRFIPMMAQDIYDIAKDKDSIGKGLLMAIPGIFGAGSQTYGKSEYVEGENKIGQPTSQIRPVQGLAETISEKAFGKQPLGSSSTYNIQTFITQMKSMSPQEQELQWKRIVQTNPELAKKIKQVLSDEKKGITVQDQTLKARGVASGDRATAIYKEFKKLKTNEEKAKLWEDYVKKGIITKDVAKQLKLLLSR